LNKFVTHVALVVSLLWLLPSCKGHESNGPQPYGILYVNGIAVNGGVETGNVRIYYLAGIHANNQYLVRTVIAPGGDLSAGIYTSLPSYKLGEAALTSAKRVIPPQSYDQLYYEASFIAPQDGDYVVVLQGTPASTAAPDVNTLYFYDLRLMSATGSALSSFGSGTVDLSSYATATGTIEPATLIVYGDRTIVTTGTYSIILTSSTLTISYPQVFVYEDNSLSVNKLLYSAISATNITVTPATREFLISVLSTSPTSSSFSPDCKITDVPLTAGTSSAPFIMLKGVSKATYTLQVGP
jgi:hypothetical protein